MSKFKVNDNLSNVEKILSYEIRNTDCVLARKELNNMLDDIKILKSKIMRYIHYNTDETQSDNIADSFKDSVRPYIELSDFGGIVGNTKPGKKLYFDELKKKDHQYLLSLLKEYDFFQMIKNESNNTNRRVSDGMATVITVFLSNNLHNSVTVSSSSSNNNRTPKLTRYIRHLLKH